MENIDEESPRNVADVGQSSAGKLAKPITIRGDDRKLSDVSKMYDRGNKGYLDPAERRMREMDKSNKGFLSNDKVYDIMQQSLELQKQMFNMKRVVIGLAVFTVILALSNLATAFAAASLAKDTTVSTESGGLNPTLQEKNTHQDIATLNKGMIVHASAISSRGREEAERRDLELIDGNETDAANANSTDANATDDASANSDANATVFDAYEITLAEAEMIWTNCKQSTPTKISHECDDGVETLSTIGCTDAQRYAGANYQYHYEDDVMINCGSPGGSPTCTVVGLKCPDLNRGGEGGGPTCSEDILGQTPSMTAVNEFPIPDEYKCEKSCECEDGCCVFYTTLICMDPDNLNSYMQCID